MAAPLVTVSRLYGAGGSKVAALTARALGWTVIDNEFVDEVARRAGLPREEVAQREERAPGLLERLARTLAVASPEMFVTTAGVPRVEDDEATIARLTERVITEAAREGRVVLVGRGAQAVLARRPDALHVLLIASKAFRERVAVERLDVAADRVADVVAQTDRERDRYVRAHYDRDRRDPLNYDLVINTERTGFDGAAALIATEVRRRGWAA